MSKCVAVGSTELKYKISHMHCEEKVMCIFLDLISKLKALIAKVKHNVKFVIHMNKTFFLPLFARKKIMHKSKALVAAMTEAVVNFSQDYVLVKKSYKFIC